MKEDRGGKVFVDSTRVGGATWSPPTARGCGPGVPVSFPVAWDDLDARRARRLHRAHRGRRCSATATRGPSSMPAPQPLPADLVEEGHAIPVARVQAMHEGKRRARAAPKEG